MNDPSTSAALRLRSARGKVGPIAPVLAVAEKEDLNAGLPAFLRDGEDIGLLDAARVDALMRLDMRERPQTVAVFRGALELELLRGLLHERVQLPLHGVGLAGQKGARFFDELPVVLKLDLPRAGRGAALDLKEEAGPRAAVVDVVGTGAQEERSLKRIDGAVHGSGAGEGSEIVALERARAAMLGDLRRFLVAPDDDVGEGLVVPEGDVVARLEALDEVGFEKKRLGFRARYSRTPSTPSSGSSPRCGSYGRRAACSSGHGSSGCAPCRRK